MIYREISDCKKILPTKGRLLALDVGTKKIGVAICDDTQTFSTPKLIIKRKSNSKDFATLLSIIQENPVIAIIFGFPIKMDGSENLMSDFVMKFVKNFEKFLHDLSIKNITLIVFDERLSSFKARTFINKNTKKSSKKDYDDISASLILEHFLDDFSQSQD
jgi:putative Holliday junction resolvase